jgi:tetratricopeptide (TPR) repeat protein
MLYTVNRVIGKDMFCLPFCPLRVRKRKPMSLSSPQKFCLGFCALVLFAVGVAFGFSLLPEYSLGKESPRDRYLRAVYILQQMEPLAAREPEDIPRKAKVSDTAESLLHHPDKILVLGYLADELGKTGKGNPRALYYEACARMALGERRQAADLLTRYVIEAPFNPDHYALLCENLYKLGDDMSLLLICREWQERDPACREERGRYSWSALYNMGRFGQALGLLRQEMSCLDWEGQVFEAKTVQALEGEAPAQSVLEQAARLNPGNAGKMLRLWNILKPKTRV